MQDHYALLGVRSSASLAEIKKAFRQQAALHHPDRNASPNAASRFNAAQQAYEVLTNPDRRKIYDENRQRQLLDNPADTARSIWNDYFQRLMQTNHL